MINKALAVALLLFFTTSLLAQRNIIISLLNAETNEPVQGAFWAYDTLQFGVSDELGGCSLVLEPETLSLTISHLSFQDTSFLLEPMIGDGNMKLLLKPARVVLPEISVSDQPIRKFRNPAHLLKLALRAVPDNYVTTQAYPTGHYREVITHEDCPVGVAEGIFEYRLSPYGEKHDHRKAWKEGWDRNYASYKRPFVGEVSLGFDHAEGTQHYPAINDAYRPIQTRYAQFSPPLEAYHVFTDGPLDMIALDKVRLGYDFLSPKGLNGYRFSLVDSSFVNGVYCYHLSFEPIDERPTRYHSLNKVGKVAAFSGDLYISIRTLAIVAYEAWNSKRIARNFSSEGTRYAPVASLRMRVNYGVNTAGKWQLLNVESRTRSALDSSYVAIRTLQLDKDAPAGKEASQKRWYGFNFLNHLHNLTYGMDSTFWADFEHSSFAKESKLLFDEDCSKSIDFSNALATKPISVPRVSPRGDLRYVKPGQQKRKDWEWLEAPSDSATLAYLRWENDYYAQYFLKNRPRLDAVAAQFSSKNQGISVTATSNSYPDTIFKKAAEGLGFYQVNSMDDELLIRAVENPPKGYLITDYGWSSGGNSFHVLAENRAYDGLLTVYHSTNEVARLNQVYQCQWQGDTLYALTNNDLLRTHAFSRWTVKDGWVKLKEERDANFEFRLHTLPDGTLVVIRESLTNASLLRKVGNEWEAIGKSMPALLAGQGGDGTACEADLAADYIIDCRSVGKHHCVILAKGARQYLYVRQESEAEWTKLDLPIATLLVQFIDNRPGAIVVGLEGVGSFGQQAIVDVANKQLELLPNMSVSAALTGYADSIIWVTSDDGTLVPCQLRWRIDQQDSLKTTLLKVYGAYGNPYFIGHNEADIAMMNLGFAIVYVHTRGGGMLGPSWYEAGRSERKINACKDYIAALRFFKKSHPLGETPLSGYAQSAGGPILGYAVNQQPDLLQAAVFDHAFLDVVGLMQRPELPLTQYEYLEWGDPSKKEIRKLQSSYSPFQNISTQTYPSMFFIGGFHDQSTPYWQIAKFVAALRWANKDDINILFRTNLRGSHPGTPFGPSQQQLYEQIAFLLTTAQVLY